MRETYARIKKNEYSIPTNKGLSKAASDMIHKMLKGDPSSRPSVMELKDHPFLKEGSVSLCLLKGL